MGVKGAMTRMDDDEKDAPGSAELPDQPRPPDRDRDLEMLRSHVAMLNEHFDTVQIFATRHDLDGTIACDVGGGNWYARYGQVREWTIKKGESARVQARRDEEES